MEGLLINGQPAVSGGSLLVPHGTVASFVIAEARISLSFDAAVEGFNWDNGNLTVNGGEFPLGMSFEVPLRADNRPGKLLFSVHTLGAVERRIDRLVSYIFYFD